MSALFFAAAVAPTGPKQQASYAWAAVGALFMAVAIWFGRRA